MTESAPSPFSPSNPFLQTAIDSTSMDAMLKCPRNYYYQIILGLRKSTIDLEFGGYIASATELYWKARCAGDDSLTATLKAVRYLLETTYTDENTQWGGYWETEWKCAGDKPWKNAKGNKAKCPYSHVKFWCGGEAPDICPECTGSIITARNYNPEHAQKHRINLIRALIWWAEDQPEGLSDGLHPYIYPDGRAAVELSFRLPLPWQTPDGEHYIVCGHFDQIGVFGDEMGPVDVKTTKSTLTESYFRSYKMSTQFATYDLAFSLLFPEVAASFAIVDAIQLMSDTVRTGRTTIRKTDAQREEHLDSIRHVIDLLETCANKANASDNPERAYPQAKHNCKICPYYDLCYADPDERPRIMEENYHVEKWNPLAVR